MFLRSHIDPCLFVPVLHIHPDGIDSELETNLKAFTPVAGAPIATILSRLDDRHKRVLVHEYYHYLQGVRLPFLHRYALLAMRRIAELFEMLSRTGIPYSEWSGIAPEFESLRSPAELANHSSGRLTLSLSPANRPVAPDVVSCSLIDLLELGTSLGEFQMSSAANDRTQPHAYDRWRKRYPAYSAVFDFCARFLEDRSLALRCMLPLTNASFFTSHPLRAFAELLARTWARLRPGSGDFATEFLSQREPCRWTELYQSWLNELPYDCESPPAVGLMGGPFHRVTDDWIGATMGSRANGLAHPILAPAGRRWLAGESTEPRLRWMLDMPGWADCMGLMSSFRLTPPFAVHHIHMPSGEDRVYYSGHFDEQDVQGDLISDNDIFRGFMADFMTMYSVVRRAGLFHYDETQRMCHHKGCPHYAANYCNLYPVIPRRFQECGFPRRIHRLIADWSSIHAEHPHRG